LIEPPAHGPGAWWMAPCVPGLGADDALVGLLRDFESCVAQSLASGRHSHPSIETSYVIEGTMLVKVAGNADMTWKAGDSSQTPAGTVHEVCAGPGQALKIISNQVITKDTPLAKPAP
jgi:quercetin dioxygenase-like cupin family protein